MLSKSFCSGPWFHLRVTSDGNYEKCRWLTETTDHRYNIADTSITQYHNSDEMSNFRLEMLNGVAPPQCNTCHYQEQFGKLSGRGKQLLKSAIKIEDFTNSTLSSPHLEDFKFSRTTGGMSRHKPTDLQIDLGNVCNSACIMCEPKASSRLTQDYQKLYGRSALFAKPAEFASWTDNAHALSTFIADLGKIQDLKYLHLLGGETLYNHAFYKIADALIASGQSKKVIVGTTTNGTIFHSRLADIIPQFKEFHLGISIETVSHLNDYIRYPSEIDKVLANIDKFVALRDTYPGLYITLRITPNVFSISEIDQLFEYLIEKRITAEACNILHKPECLRMEVMPTDIREETIAKLEYLVSKYQLVKHNVSNIRNPANIDQVTADTVIEYLDFLKGYEVPGNVNELRLQLVEFLKSFESLRNNTILDYAPRYKDFLRSIGY